MVNFRFFKILSLQFFICEIYLLPFSGILYAADCSQSFTNIPGQGYSEEEKAAIIRYLGTEAGPLNKYLRGEGSKDPKLDELAKILDGIFAKEPFFGNEIIVYRAENYSGIQNLELGSIVNYRAFTSATPNERMVFEMAEARTQSRNNFGHALRIHLKPGDKILSLKKILEWSQSAQDEYLMPRNTKFRVDNAVNDGKKWIYDLSVVH